MKTHCQSDFNTYSLKDADSPAPVASASWSSDFTSASWAPWSVRDERLRFPKSHLQSSHRGYNFICSIFWVSNCISLWRKDFTSKKEKMVKDLTWSHVSLLCKWICHCFLTSLKWLVAELEMFWFLFSYREFWLTSRPQQTSSSVFFFQRHTEFIS